MKPGQIRPIVVSVFRDGDRIFLAQYHDPSSGERFYRPLGGAIAFGEHSRECIVREIREEMGTEITDLNYVAPFSMTLCQYSEFSRYFTVFNGIQRAIRSIALITHGES